MPLTEYILLKSYSVLKWFFGDIFRNGKTSGKGRRKMLTNKQLSSVIINAIVVKMLVTFPRNIFVYCANASWLTAIYATAIAFGLFFVIQKLYPAKNNVIALADRVGGRGVRIITGIAVFTVLALNFVSIVRVFPAIIRLVLLQKTYVEIIGTVFVLVVIFGASCGIESIGRVQQLFLPVAGVVFGAFIIMLIPDMNFAYLMPIFGNGLKSIAIDGLSTLSVFTDLLVLNILLPKIKDSETYRKAGKKAILIGGACSVLIFFLYGACYSYPASTEFIVPVYQLERLINLSDFFSRLEALFQFVWSISILLYSALYGAVLAEVWRDTFGLKHSKPLIAPIIIGLVGVAVIPESLNDMLHFEGIINKWLYIPAFVIPLLIGIIYKMFHVKHLEENYETNSI